VIPRPPTASGTTDSLAPYVVGALAAGALAGLGLKIRDALTYLGLVLSGAWVLADIWQAVQEDRAMAGKWSCTASCNLEGPYPRCDGHATGTGRGSSEAAACREAKRAAVHAPRPMGCTVRHCRCTCTKS